MDWHSFLSKTNLDPSLVYDYAFAFTRNELDRNDLPYFNHEFLQSMGISIAKHRLEILKLVRKEKVTGVSKLLTTIKQCFKKWKRHRNKASILSIEGNRKMVRRSQSERKNEGPPLMITYGSPMMFSSSRIDCPSIKSGWKWKMDHGECYYDEYLGGRCEENKWEAMFRDMKPT